MFSSEKGGQLFWGGSRPSREKRVVHYEHENGVVDIGLSKDGSERSERNETNFCSDLPIA